MSESVPTAESVGEKLAEVIADMKKFAFADEGGSQLSRVGGFVTALLPIQKAWADGGNVSGKAPGKRGRKPGTKNASTLAKEAAAAAAALEAEGVEVSEGAEPVEAVEAVAGADAPLTETQVEMDPPPTGRSRSTDNE